MDLRLDTNSSYVQYKVQICCNCMFCDVNFMYRLYHDCARTLKRSLSGKIAIVELSGDFGFAHSSSKRPCTLASFSRARMPRSACTHDVTCELYSTSSKPLHTTCKNQSDIIRICKCIIREGRFSKTTWAGK